MKKLINSKLLLQVIVASMVATLATAGIVAAATTIGSNINTGGTLTTTGATTIYGATSIGGALTATSTLAVTGVTTLTGQLNFVNASSTGWIKAATINSDTGTVDFGDDNITMTGSLGVTGARLTKGWFTDLEVTNAIAGSITGNAATVTTNANLTGDVTSVGNATTLTNAPVIAKVLTGYTSGAGAVAATDTILEAIQKLNGNDATNANLTGIVTSVGNATAIADKAISYTKLANGTAGNLITWDASGVAALVATGDAGQVLTSGGAGVAPTFQAIVAALNNASSWTVAQKLDAGITVDTTNFTVDGTTGAVATASTLGVTGLATATGGFTSVATTTLSGRIQGASPLIFDGVTANDDANVLTVSVTDLDGARAQTLQNNSGVIALGTAGNTLFFTTTGATGVTLPTSGTLVGSADTGTVTSTMILNNTIVSDDLATDLAISTTGIISAATSTATTALVIPSGATPSAADACTNTDVGALRIDTDAAAGSKLIICNGTTWLNPVQ